MTDAPGGVPSAWFFPEQGSWTRNDYFRLPKTQHLVELVDGKLVVSPPPDTLHQRLVIDLARLLRGAARVGRRGRVVAGPIRLCLGKSLILQADLVYLRRRSPAQVGEMCIDGAPDLVIEISSIDTKDRDTIDKTRAYYESGIPEYWVVDPLRHRLMMWTAGKASYNLAHEVRGAESITSRMLTSLTLSPDEIFPKR